MRDSVKSSDPQRFLDAIRMVHKPGLADVGAYRVAPLRHHAEPRVRMYATMALTVLRSRGPFEAHELIVTFDDPNEDIEVRRAAAHCLVLFGENARDAIPLLAKAFSDINDPRCHSAL